MNVEEHNDYREGLFWLIGGAGIAVMSLARFSNWHGIQPWYLYTLGVGLFIVMAIIAPRTRLRHSRPRHMWLPLILALAVSLVLAVASDEMGFVAVFPIMMGLFSMGTGLWLMLRPNTKVGGAGR